MSNGFFMVSNELFKLHAAKVGPSVWMVYSCLKMYADKDGVCFPSFSQIAKLIGMSTRTVIRAIKVLEDEKLIVIYKTLGGRNFYQCQDVTPTSDTSDTSDNLSPVTPMSLPSDTDVTGTSDKNDIALKVQQYPYNKTHEQELIKRKSKKRKSPTEKPKPDLTESFQKIWTAYPRHEEKKAAFDQYRKLNPDHELKDKMLLAIEVKKKTGTEPRFWKYLFRWLRDRSWEDEPEITPDKPRPPVGYTICSVCGVMEEDDYCVDGVCPECQTRDGPRLLHSVK